MTSQRKLGQVLLTERKLAKARAECTDALRGASALERGGHRSRALAGGGPAARR